jgi:hypothetical protein
LPAVISRRYWPRSTMESCRASPRWCPDLGLSLHSS